MQDKTDEMERMREKIINLEMSLSTEVEEKLQAEVSKLSFLQFLY